MVSTWPTRSTASWKYSCLIQPGTLYHLSQASPGIFNPLESLAMYVGAICHDLDHRQAVQQKMTIVPTIKSSKNPQSFCSTPISWFSFPVWPIVSDRIFTFRGFNNKFMIDISSPLSGMYATSVMENHHFAMAVSILQQVLILQSEISWIWNLLTGAKQLAGQLAPWGVQGGDQQHEALHPGHRPGSLLPQQGAPGQHCEGEHVRLGAPRP